ncbi:type II toxin-antitoxin system ParD family antitoxin [Methylobacterium sp. WL7]|uniref:type II toxin-antitoxin system ParD family antitoxin n=1 Tax=Methylobacterium sp. WL7 TaxID=2603900 RepID=UPI0011C92FAD|nr:type II toxin-antitoxin system ParD family antitoxin [Methylobacterium sp. WL7]TXN41010.1 type II toxin-antitoxin system ParD family antitoxin [Methylobacterium sp. WL7]
MATLNVSLTPEMLAFVNELTRSGGYTSVSEVVRDGLRLLEQEKAVAEEKHAILKREIDAGLADAQAGRFSDKSAREIAQDILRTAGRAP